MVLILACWTVKAIELAVVLVGVLACRTVKMTESIVVLLVLVVAC